MVIIEILLFLAIIGSGVAFIATLRALWPSAEKAEKAAVTSFAVSSAEASDGAGEQRCPQCGSAQPAGNRFCGQCGSPLERPRCPTCGHELSAADRFCGGCGAPLRKES